MMEILFTIPGLPFFLLVEVELAVGLAIPVTVKQKGTMDSLTRDYTSSSVSKQYKH